MKSTTFRRTTLAAVLGMGLTAGYAAWSGHTPMAAQASPQPPAATVAAPLAAQPLPDMSTIVDRYGPAVVNISVSGTLKDAKASQDLPQLDPDDPFYEFFRRFAIPQPHDGVPLRGLGSGFIVSSDGIILTNAHVVDGADTVTVKLTDKREFKAKVLGIDKPSDVAVLRIDARNLPTVRIGSAARTRVGEWVLAIGSPFGFENSATAGIVSATSRSLPDDSYVPFIQTDVAVNPGNSGGPLFNTAGEVIGVNAQIYSRSGGYQGLSFAIPIDVAVGVEQQILAHGKVERGRLGVVIQEMNQSLAESFGLKQAQGALVSSVEKNGPGDKAGLQPGDVILGVNGKAISASNEVPPLIAAVRPGDHAKLEIWRKGAKQEVEVKVGSLADAKVASATPTADKGRLGLAVRPLSPDEQRQAEVKGGLLVEDASGPAARAGIQPGDVLLSVNGEPIAGVDQLRAAVGKAGKRIALLIQRNDARIFVPVDLG
ncbi:MAG TPA: DegQ family serine endoprotease [Rhodocyclaceae bacterium]|nr:DegQ family serine endoprotease [Rhodocyclaceae bacterium]